MLHGVAANVLGRFRPSDQFGRLGCGAARPWPWGRRCLAKDAKEQNTFSMFSLLFWKRLAGRCCRQLIIIIHYSYSDDSVFFLLIFFLLWRAMPFLIALAQHSRTRSRAAWVFAENIFPHSFVRSCPCSRWHKQLQRFFFKKCTWMASTLIRLGVSILKGA